MECIRIKCQEPPISQLSTRWRDYGRVRHPNSDVQVDFGHLFARLALFVSTFVLEWPTKIFVKLDEQQKLRLLQHFVGTMMEQLERKWKFSIINFCYAHPEKKWNAVYATLYNPLDELDTISRKILWIITPKYPKILIVPAFLHVERNIIANAMLYKSVFGVSFPQNPQNLQK